MPSKKKDSTPKTPEQFFKDFYDPDKFEERKKYLNGPANDELTQSFERSIASRVDFPIERINERKNIKTPDFISSDRKTAIEATSINMAPIQGEVIDEEESKKWHEGNKRVDKINEAINHATEKDYEFLRSEYGYERATGDYVLFVRVDHPTAKMFSFYDDLEDAVKKSIFAESGLSGIVFITETSGYVKKVAFIRKGSSIKLMDGTPIVLIDQTS